MSKFDFDAFTGDYPLAVSKERYTVKEAVEIAKRELGTGEIEMLSGYVHYGFGIDDNDPCEKARNTWWLTISKGCPKRCCPVYVFRVKES